MKRQIETTIENLIEIIFRLEYAGPRQVELRAALAALEAERDKQ